MANAAVELARSTHPAPTVAVTTVAVLLAAGAGLDGGRTLLVGAAVLAGQLSIGLSNDWLDRARDAEAGRTDKPVAAGRVDLRAVRGGAIAAAAASVSISLLGGPAVAAANAVLLAAGWAYNVGLKATILSVVAYLVGFGALPAIVTAASEPPVWPPPWSVLAAALLGGAAHVANVLPDLTADRRAGIRGFPHRIGRAASVATAVAAMLCAVGAILIGVGPSGPIVVGLAVIGAVSVALVVTAVRRPDSRAPFLLVLAGSVTVVVLLVGSAGRLLT